MEDLRRLIGASDADGSKATARAGLREPRQPRWEESLMPQTTYAYKVRDSCGKVLEGTLEADNTELGSQQAAPDGLLAHRTSRPGVPPAWP